MDQEEFGKCLERGQYDEFMSFTLALNGLRKEDYGDFMPKIFDLVINNKEKDPYLLYEQVIIGLRGEWTASPKLPFHGPWHHGLVGGIIIASLRNNCHRFDDNDVKEALYRGLMIPGGGCGFLGVCGAATGLGIAFSIINRSTPFHDRERSSALEMSSKAMKMVARLGGPRCCAMSTYATLDIAKRELALLGYGIDSGTSQGRCHDHELNPQCHGRSCPYYPR
ncbi:MAG: hypothetical protein JW825_03105 [Candidatus Methanofastidiosa archaeon]|nr:hypothetical protein [Candidatus Methanofastidiosa archaeon]